MRIPYKKAIGQDVKIGRPSIGKKPGKIELEILYIEKEKSIREIAIILGCSKEKVFRSLKEYGIKTRDHTKKSKLWGYKKKYIEEGIKEKGIRGFARELKVNDSTLRYHIKLRRREKK